MEGAEPIHLGVSSFMDVLGGHKARSKDDAGLDAPWGEHFMDDDEPSRSESNDRSVGGGSDILTTTPSK